MRKDSKLSRMLHVLLHMARENKPFTSDYIAEMLDTNPVVVRRTMSGLKKAGFVDSEKGPGGGWTLVQDLKDISLYDIYLAVGEPSIFAIGNQNEEPNCLVEVVVNRSLDQAFINAQQILISNLKATTLAQLAHEFQIEWDQRIANK
ncbi:Rrf2 family transcriptional regulator [Acinetobacter baumannii]|uniref:Rrf2 family transcriptional regulator n=1 Tax=Acinetobacter baumannii TaxID=470 RepID=UPI00102079C2|nr:Rrf2 family transcriptional regulator [Acinetobacter baumannii]RYL18407.1 Rrf2 family transcriptional regulator [Acinetobacter baumannii]